MKSVFFLKFFALSLSVFFTAQCWVLASADDKIITLSATSASGPTKVQIKDNEFWVGDKVGGGGKFLVTNFEAEIGNRASELRLLALIDPNENKSDVYSVTVLFRPRTVPSIEPHSLWEFNVSKKEEILGLLDLGDKPGILTLEKNGASRVLRFKSLVRRDGRDFAQELHIEPRPGAPIYASLSAAKKDFLFKNLESFAGLPQNISLQMIDGFLMTKLAVPVQAFEADDSHSESFHLSLTPYYFAIRGPRAGSSQPNIEGRPLFFRDIPQSNLSIVVGDVKVSALNQDPSKARKLNVYFLDKTTDLTRLNFTNIGRDETPLGFARSSGRTFVFFSRPGASNSPISELSSIFAFDDHDGFEKEYQLSEKIADGERSWRYAGDLRNINSSLTLIREFLKNITGTLKEQISVITLFLAEENIVAITDPRPRSSQVESLPEAFSIPISKELIVQISHRDIPSLGDFSDGQNRGRRWALSLPPNLLSEYRKDKLAVLRKLSQLIWLGSKDISFFGIPLEATEVPAIIERTLGKDPLKVYQAELFAGSAYDPWPRLIFRKASSNTEPLLQTIIALAKACQKL